MTGTISNVTRVESWSYFQPKGDPLALPPPGSDPLGSPDYTFLGDRAELAVRVAGSRWDLSGAFNYVRLENLPTRAIGPGALGSGAFYFAATGVRYSYQLYLGELTAKFKSADQRTTFTVGRMPFESGGEFTSSSSSLGRLKRERVQARLIGNFDGSLYQRRFDGARFDRDRDRWHFTAAAFVPTQGGFEESTNLTIPKIQVGVAAVERKRSARSMQAFGYFYRDRRGEMAVVDNTFSLDRPVDVTIATFGGSYVRSLPWIGGNAESDLVMWGAVQTGGWYGHEHVAASAALEIGHLWTDARLKPRLRAGYLWASGDRNGGDDRHGTFFQMLPSSQKYGMSAAYAQMNLRDAFAQLAIEPGRVRARIEVHALHLASGADLWYHGSGATSSDGRFFGFAGRAARGDTALGTVLEGTIDVPIRRHWSISGYAGTMSAGAVVRHWFTNKRLVLWSLDNVIRF